jgi:putative transposase
MPRRARIAVANYPHHIVQRGHNRRAVSVTDRDRLTYLETLREFEQSLTSKSTATVSDDESRPSDTVDPGNNAQRLGLLMKRLAGRHTSRINKLERRTGTSWAGSLLHAPPAFATSM